MGGDPVPSRSVAPTRARGRCGDAGKGRKGGGHGDSPSLPRLQEQALGDSRFLPLTVAHPVTIGPVNHSLLDREQAEIPGLEKIGPLRAGRLEEGIEPGFGAGWPAEGKPLGVEVAGEVSLLVLAPYRVQIGLKELPGGHNLRIFLGLCRIRGKEGKENRH
jgi:hypothetical protein